jgi:putative ABC transport system substrate-binding protein
VRRRRVALLLIIAVGMPLSPLALQAQPLTSIPRIGVLAPLAPPPALSPDIDGFRRGLAELGYVEGQNIKVEYRWEAGRRERIRELVAELVRLPVNVLVLASETRVHAAKDLIRATPVVLSTATDPVAAGLAASLARPSGNTTGFSMFTLELASKRTELLKELLPQASKVAVFRGPRAGEAQLRETTAALQQQGMQVVPVHLQDASELQAGFQRAKRAGAAAVITLQDPFFATLNAQIAELGLKHRLPIMTGEPGAVEAGILMRYGPNIPDLWRRAAGYVDKILKGTPPGQLPIERAAKFDLAINMTTAKALGLNIPPSLWLRAEQVIQ